MSLAIVVALVVDNTSGGGDGCRHCGHALLSVLVAMSTMMQMVVGMTMTSLLVAMLTWWWVLKPKLAGSTQSAAELLK